MFISGIFEPLKYCIMSRSSFMVAKLAFLFFLFLLVACNSGTKRPIIKDIPNKKCNTNLPKSTGLVNDYIHLFSVSEAETLASILKDMNTRDSVEMTVVTIDSFQLGSCNLQDFTLELANKWEVGAKTNFNGIVMCIAPGMQQIRIENGTGTQLWLTNEKTQDIINNSIIPHYMQSNFFEGTKQCILAIEKLADAKVAGQ